MLYTVIFNSRIVNNQLMKIRKSYTRCKEFIWEELDLNLIFSGILWIEIERNKIQFS